MSTIVSDQQQQQQQPIGVAPDHNEAPTAADDAASAAAAAAADLSEVAVADDDDDDVDDNRGRDSPGTVIGEFLAMTDEGADGVHWITCTRKNISEISLETKIAPVHITEYEACHCAGWNGTWIAVADESFYMRNIISGEVCRIRGIPLDARVMSVHPVEGGFVVVHKTQVPYRSAFLHLLLIWRKPGSNGLRPDSFAMTTVSFPWRMQIVGEDDENPAYSAAGMKQAIEYAAAFESLCRDETSDVDGCINRVFGSFSKLERLVAPCASESVGELSTERNSKTAPVTSHDIYSLGDNSGLTCTSTRRMVASDAMRNGYGLPKNTSAFPLMYTGNEEVVAVSFDDILIRGSAPSGSKFVVRYESLTPVKDKQTSSEPPTFNVNAAFKMTKQNDGDAYQTLYTLFTTVRDDTSDCVWTPNADRSWNVSSCKSFKTGKIKQVVFIDNEPCGPRTYPRAFVSTESIRVHGLVSTSSASQKTPNDRCRAVEVADRHGSFRVVLAPHLELCLVADATCKVHYTSICVYNARALIGLNKMF